MAAVEELKLTEYRHLTVGELRAWLANVPDDWICWAYEGEACGIAVANPNNEDEDSFAHTPTPSG